MKYIIPFYKDKYNYRYNVSLEGKRYFFLFQYNSRMDRWIMSISNYKKEPIFSGIPVLLGVNLFQRFSNSERPPGGLFFINAVYNFTEAGRDTISDDYTLVYCESDDEDYIGWLNE